MFLNHQYIGSFKLCFILVLLSWGSTSKAQQQICLGSVNNYVVDEDENDGEGTQGSIYTWWVDSPSFNGVIRPITFSNNQIEIDWKNTPIGNYTLLVEEESNGCKTTQELIVTIQDGLTPPAISNQYLCPTDESVTFNAGGGYSSYIWYNANGDVVSNTAILTTKEAGIYTLEVGQDGCTAIQTVEVIEVQFPIFTVNVNDSNAVVIQGVGGEKNLEYQLEDEQGNIIRSWQLSETFYDLTVGTYIVKIRSVNGLCVTSLNIDTSVLSIPNIFTPNGDGINDTWDLSESLLHYSEATINIYDRYGKSIKTLNQNTGFIWDGKYLGNPLPTTSYWYIIDLGNGKVLKGHVLLKNK